MPIFHWIDTRDDDYPKGFDCADLFASGEVTDEEGYLKWLAARRKDGPPIIQDAPRAKPEPTPAKQKPVTERRPAPAPAATRGAAVAAIRPGLEPDEDGDYIPVPPEYSENGLLKKFVPYIKNKVIYTADQNVWYIWEGTRWERDSSGVKALAYARHFTDELSSVIEGRPDLGNAGKRIAEKVATVGMWEKLIKGAKTFPEVQRSVVQLDADPYLLNTPGGIVDLRTGQMRPTRPDDLVSKQTAVIPGGNAPRWLEFLREATRGDQSLVDYLQVVAGYCLTGSTKEQKFFFCHGGGGNGKGTFINALGHVLGDYAVVAPSSLFMAQRFSGGHSEDLARLAGSRLCLSQEIEAGARWAEALIKSLTGGDVVTARRPYERSFSFFPTFKIMFSGNHKPQLRTVDPAIRRRLFLVPFEFEIPEDKQDGGLPDYLHNVEGGAILQWCIDGARKWMQRGLRAPEIVSTATAEYLSEEDIISSFIKDRLARDRGMVRSSLVYAAYSEWALEHGEYRKTQKLFSRDMAARGYKIKRASDGVYYHGLRIKSPAERE